MSLWQLESVFLKSSVSGVASIALEASPNSLVVKSQNM